ncbi:transcriptional regulator BetI [Aurantimonas sp. MSK8Z-1]|uniref:choline-binding transcriptional repressor BetI n=1 Tax=Mangrovibrevibacter kandeliae TaxID=2968473 RepID=UPI00211971FD|nr:transcriptional regulator BetI [Aurantimonas sp. MSK8Z-1]MCW4115078.1 transcriptional regulator BetI [Aurantimonas sp. MSK8Z-1]
MPRKGVEAERRETLIRAAIEAVDAGGSLEVTVAEIARRADVSPALAHHYFGGKEDLMLAAMRHILDDYRAGVTKRLAGSATPRERISAIIEGSFEPAQFASSAVTAWLAFYLHARRSPEAARLLTVYFGRLESNLVDALAALVGRARARPIAAAAGAMIDGVWLRQALTNSRGPDREAAIAALERFIDGEIHADH